MFEVIGTLGWREGVEECADFVPEGVDGSGGGLFQERLEFGEHHFDRIEVG